MTGMPRGEGAAGGNGGLEGGVKLSDLIPKFDGTSDVTEWLQQLEVAKVAVGIADVAKVLPAFLRGNAFTVYANLPLEKKKSYEDIAEALTTAFGIDEHVVFQDLVSRSWREGEPVDVYVATLRRLASLAGVGERVVRMVLLNGLPVRVGMPLKTTPSIKEKTLDQVVELARCLMAAASESPQLGSFHGSMEHVAHIGGPQGDVGAAAVGGRRIRCFGCSETGHFVRNCPNGRQRKGKKLKKEDDEAALENEQGL